jgi:hypothetical protein
MLKPFFTVSPMVCEPIPYEVEQGIFSAEQGIVSTEQGGGANVQRIVGPDRIVGIDR